jgi:hypothetical protein
MDLHDTMIYKHAIYWSVVTISHIGVGDITAITVPERALNCFVILVGTFSYAILFGDVAALVSGLSSELKGKLFDNYQRVMGFLQKRGLTEQFGTKVSQYYNYMWSHEMGVDQNVILEELPANLKSDIRICRYQNILSQSSFFHGSNGEIEEQLCRSIFRLMKV